MFIDVCPSLEHVTCNMSLLCFLKLKLNGYEIIQGAQRSKGGIICPFINPTSCKWSDPKSYNQPCVLITFPGFWIWWPMTQLQELLLTNLIAYSDSYYHSFSFHVQAMILTGSSWVFHLTSASVDGN